MRHLFLSTTYLLSLFLIFSQAILADEYSKQYKSFDKMTDKEREDFYSVYQEDLEPFEKGGFKRPWIVGEVPVKQDPKLVFKPSKGRLNVRGVLKKEKGTYTFTTKLRTYNIVDRYFKHHLHELGLDKKDSTVEATIDAYWMRIDRTSGYTLLYYNDVKLHNPE